MQKKRISWFNLHPATASNCHSKCSHKREIDRGEENTDRGTGSKKNKQEGIRPEERKEDHKRNPDLALRSMHIRIHESCSDTMKKMELQLNHGGTKPHEEVSRSREKEGKSSE